MNYPTRNTCDNASKRLATMNIATRNSFKMILTGVLLLAASSASAGLQIIPVVDIYVTPEIVPVSIRRDPGDQPVDYFIITLSTAGLTGESTIQGSDFPPTYDIPASAKGVLPFDQDLELEIDVAAGTVSGRSETRYVDAASPYLAATAEVSGNATCLPLNGLECGQLVVNLELQGVLSDPNNPANVGRLRTEMLGSFVWDGTDVGHWAAMSANAMIGGNDGLIDLLSSMALTRPPREPHYPLDY